MNKTKVLILCLAALVLIFVAGTAIAAPNYTVDWQVFSGGGEPASVGSFTMNGSLGQSIIGTSSSTNYSIDHGYWLKGSYKTFLPLVLK